MSNSGSAPIELPHVVFLPSGMGQLTPFFRLATMLASHNCKVTFITTQPSATLSKHICSFFSNYPEIKHLELKIIPFNTSSSTINDPFINQFKAINNSLHLLGPLLSSLPQPISAIFSDFVLTAGLTQITADLGISFHYVVSTTSALFYSTVAYLPVLNSAKFSGNFDQIQIPGIAPLPKSSIPPTWLDKSPSNHLLESYLMPNAQSLSKLKGVLVNTFHWFEPETIAALNDGKVLSNLPPVFPIGPFEPYKLEKDKTHFPWLDEQSAESVVYVSFGSREVISTDQIREIGYGLEISGCKFFWVLKVNNVDKDGEEEVRELLGDSFLERTKNKGRIMKAWVKQEDILAHPAIGGFVNQCKWDSVMEAARQGVPMLAWPQHGDQKINAAVVEKMGLGFWVESWGWGGERLVKKEEIGEMVRQMMRDSNLRDKVKKVGNEARKAYELGGSSQNVLMGVIDMLKQKDRKKL